MIAALLTVFYLDNQLDRLSIENTVLQTLFLGRTHLPSGLPMLAATIFLIGLATRELTQIFRVKNVLADHFTLFISATIGCLLIYALPYNLSSQTTLAIYASFMIGLFVFSLIRHSWGGRTDGAIAVGSATMFALIYLGTMPGFFLAIRRWHSAWVIAAIILITKSCDIGAYFTGRALGKHKLIPWLSPGKTWEGLIGGVIFSGLVSTGLVALGNHFDLAGQKLTVEGVMQVVHLNYPLWFAAIAGMLLGLVGQFGDLTASLFKRDAGIKDSGRSIPGFGGLIDVVDSPLVAAPVAYWLLELATRLAESA